MGGFTAADYAVLVAYLLGTALFGALLGRGQQTTRDYFLAGKRMPWWAISASIVATETSTLTFIGAPAIAYTGNMTFLQIAIGYVVGKLLVSLILIPSYFKGEIQTAYEVLQFRFGGRVRSFSAFLFQGTRALADGVRLFATGLVLAVVTQISDVWTIAIIAVITVVYTFYGGMTAVVWNDLVQLLIYLAGAALAFYEILNRLPGGWAEVTAVAAPLGKFALFDFTLDLGIAYTFWAGLIGGAFLTFATHGTDQMMVQRYLASGSRPASQLALIVSAVVVLLQFWFFLLIGVMLFVFYQRFPLEEPLAQADRIFPIFIVQEMPAGISGLIIAAIFAAAMSTLSSSLNSLASSSVNDFYRRILKVERDERFYLRVSRLMTLAWAGVLIVIAVLARNWGSVLEVGLTITSVTMGSILGIFLLGIWSPKTGEKSGLIAMLSGLAVMLALVQTGQVAWTWYVLTGTLVTFLVGRLLAAFSTNAAAD